MGYGIRKVTVGVAGQVSGFAEDNESHEQAVARLILEAEMASNEKGNVRLHLTYSPKAYDIILGIKEDER